MPLNVDEFRINNTKFFNRKPQEASEMASPYLASPSLGVELMANSVDIDNDLDVAGAISDPNIDMLSTPIAKVDKSGIPKGVVVPENEQSLGFASNMIAKNLPFLQEEIDNQSKSAWQRSDVLIPLASLVDSWTGSNIADSLHKQEALKAQKQSDALTLLKSMQTKSLDAMDSLDNQLKIAKLKRNGIVFDPAKGAFDYKDSKDIARIRQNDQDFMRLVSAIEDPSSRRKLGRYAMISDIGSGTEALASVWFDKYKKANKIPLESPLTREQYEQALSQMPRQQVEEIVKTLDRQLTQAAPTVAGMEHLRVSTLGSMASNLKQVVTGDVKPANLGSFVALYLETVQRESKVANDLKNRVIESFDIGFEHLKESDPDRFNRLMENAKREAKSYIQTEESLQHMGQQQQEEYKKRKELESTGVNTLNDLSQFEVE